MKSEDKSEVFPCPRHDGIELQLHPFLTFKLDGSECLFHAPPALSSGLNTGIL
jgi:hypothetical protein